MARPVLAGKVLVVCFSSCGSLGVSGNKRGENCLLKACYPRNLKNVTSHTSTSWAFCNLRRCDYKCWKLNREHMDLGTTADLKLNLLPLCKLRGQTPCKAPLLLPGGPGQIHFNSRQKTRGEALRLVKQPQMLLG